MTANTLSRADRSASATLGRRDDPTPADGGAKKQPAPLETLTPTELSARLSAIYPYFFGNEARTLERAAIYRDALDFASGERLAKAYVSTMSRWTSREPPLPAHFIEHLPAAASGPDQSVRRNRWEVAVLMQQLVVTKRGREIVAAGFARALVDRVAGFALSPPPWRPYCPPGYHPPADQPPIPRAKSDRPLPEERARKPVNNAGDLTPELLDDFRYERAEFLRGLEMVTTMTMTTGVGMGASLRAMGQAMQARQAAATAQWTDYLALIDAGIPAREAVAEAGILSAPVAGAAGSARARQRGSAGDAAMHDTHREEGAERQGGAEREDGDGRRDWDEQNGSDDDAAL